MEEPNLEPLLKQLGSNIANLEDALEPLLQQALSETARQLPVLDRAKLYALVVYSIESLLFSYLRLHGVKATDHPVFRELTRVKQYFEKIKRAENGPEKRHMELDKAAANRFIKHALASSRESKDAEGVQKAAPSSDAQDTEVPRKEKLDGLPDQDLPSSDSKAAKKRKRKHEKQAKK